MKKKGLIALFQIILLVISIVAVSYMIGGEFKTVSAQYNKAKPPSTQNLPRPAGAEVEQLLIAAGGLATEEALDAFYNFLAGKEITQETINQATAHAIGSETVATAKPTPGGSPGDAPSKFLGIENFFAPADVWAALTNAGILAGASAIIAGLYVGLTTGDWSRAGLVASRAAAASATAYVVTLAILATAGGPPGWVLAGTMIVFNWLFSLLGGQTDRDIFFQCKAWQPQKGGENCNLCNDKIFPCTEYQCRSFGSGCELINKDTDKPKCIAKDPNDINPPNITAWQGALLENYTYTPLPRGQYGVEIKYRNKECLPAFQPFTFGIALDKEGYCKIEDHSTKNFSEMSYDFGGISYAPKQFTQLMTFPGTAYLNEELEKLNNSLEITNNGQFEYYVRCESASNAISNREEFLFKFCIDPEKDVTPTDIRGFNWKDNAPVAWFNETEERKVNIEVYTNKQSQCKWDHEDKDYKDMAGGLTCPSSLRNLNNQLSYTCYGNLTGLENQKENKFYFRCNDTLGNVNPQSKTLTLVGTKPLTILSVEPTGTIKGGTSPIKVTLKAETTSGFNSGKAKCYDSPTEKGTYTKFSETDSQVHSTNLWLNETNYNYFIRCIDDAGNSDTKTVSFNVETDTQAPAVVRAFHDGNSLKIITNEKATCVYNTQEFECNYEFKDGIEMRYLNDKEHFTDWNTLLNFYIKCQDDYGNEPPTGCSIIVRPFAL